MSRPPERRGRRGAFHGEGHLEELSQSATTGPAMAMEPPVAPVAISSDLEAALLLGLPATSPSEGLEDKSNSSADPFAMAAEVEAVASSSKDVAPPMLPDASQDLVLEDVEELEVGEDGPIASTANPSATAVSSVSTKRSR